MSPAPTPLTPGRVIVAMSGGVDSSVAAALLLQQGYEPVGVTLHLWDYPDDGSVKGRCCAPEDQHDARRVCDKLGIPHYSFDRRDTFANEVVNPFVDAYLRGETPSPCVACNKGPKLRELFSIADALGATHLATGHYARVVVHNGRSTLARGTDPQKDQSYFLHALTPSKLDRMIFPLGSATKKETRAIADDLDLPGAQKGESQELCFVPTGRYDAFVQARAGDRIRPGNILGPDGSVVGKHEGIHKFTVGQRKGLGVSLGSPAHVVSIDHARNDVSLGPRDALRVRKVIVRDATFDEALARADVQVRSGRDVASASIVRRGTETDITFDQPIAFASIGQFAVGYEGDHVLGGGQIIGVVRENEAFQA